MTKQEKTDKLIEVLITILRAVEWQPKEFSMVCSLCHNTSYRGHADDCWFAEVDRLMEVETDD